MLDSTIVVLELGVISDISAPHGQSTSAMRTGTARREASCACVVLVLETLFTQGNQMDSYPAHLTTLNFPVC